MSVLQIVFILTSLFTLLCAVMVITARRMMHSAFWLVGALLGVAILFALLESRFFVAVQILVYIGAIAILIIFVLMLTRNVMDEQIDHLNKLWGLAIVPAIGVFGGLIVVLSRWVLFFSDTRTVAQGGEDITAIGKALVDPMGFLLPFEVASVLLLAALIGAIYVASERKGGGR